jgi:hypothetical protein
MSVRVTNVKNSDPTLVQPITLLERAHDQLEVDRVPPAKAASADSSGQLCEAIFGSLWTYDGEFFHSVAVRNVPSELADFIRRPYPAGPATPLGSVARTKAVVAVADLANDERYRSGDNTDREWVAGPVQLGGARSSCPPPRTLPCARLQS